MYSRLCCDQDLHLPKQHLRVRKETTYIFCRKATFERKHVLHTSEEANKKFKKQKNPVAKMIIKKTQKRY